MPVRDFNDMYFFAQVVERGGFSAASRALDVPKSRLSRRVAALEERLGVRLIQRSSRTFSVTSAGQLFFERCVGMIAAADAAESVLAEVQAKPRGVVHLSCTITMAQFLLGPLLPRFLLDHPQVDLRVLATNRMVNLIEQGIDVALLVHRTPLQDSLLVERMIGVSPQVLVASPKLFRRMARPQNPDDLQRLPALSAGGSADSKRWDLIGPHGTPTAACFAPRMLAENLSMLKHAALSAVGVARLPRLICREDIRRGDLEIVLPGWTLPPHEIHAIYPSRKGMVPAVRTLIDFLVQSIRRELA